LSFSQKRIIASCNENCLDLCGACGFGIFSGMNIASQKEIKDLVQKSAIEKCLDNGLL
jgi:hypothetical protein